MHRISHGRIKKDKVTHVVIDIDNGSKVPIGCSVCSFLFRTAEDELSIKEYECCDACAQQWARPNKKRWSGGWRPDQQEIDKILQRRQPLLVAL